MILYLDTSSLVKTYLEESYSDLVRGWVGEAACVATSRVAYAEALSAFAWRHVQGDVDDHKFELIQEVLAVDWTRFILMPVLERTAGALAVKHLLRGFDAIHLAAASNLPDAFRGEPVMFSSFDARLLRAARAEGLDTLHLSSQDGLVMEEVVEYG